MEWHVAGTEGKKTVRGKKKYNRSHRTKNLGSVDGEGKRKK